MKKMLIKLPLLLMFGTVITSCTTNMYTERDQSMVRDRSGATFISSSGEKVAVAPVKESNQPISGDIGRAMDQIDKTKMWHALDNPIGKPARWVNANTGITYTVVPTKKVTVNGNQFCRKYTSTATKGDQSRQTTGVACVSSDGNWHSASVD